MSVPMCPHCGQTFNVLVDYHLVPEHSFDGKRCPGTLQIPRNKEADRRPLWKDQNDATMTTTLKQTTCRECHKPILVAPYSPHPEQEYTTGMSATRWDADTQDEYFVGWICETCAFERVGEGKPGAISGPSLEFHY